MLNAFTLLLTSQVYEAEKRYQSKENEFMAYKEQQLTKPEVKLESEINLLKMEKVRRTHA